MTMQEKLSNILSTGVVGYLVVFAVLAVIWAVLAIFGRVAAGSGEGESVDGVSVGGAVTPAVTDGDSYEEEYTEGYDDGELIAAIAAAISAHTGKPLSSFRVVSFKRSKIR